MGFNQTDHTTFNALNDFQLYRSVSAQDAASQYPALAAVSFIDMTYSPLGSSNVIYLFTSGNGGAVTCTLRMMLPPQFPSLSTITNNYVIAATQACTAQTLYTFQNLPAARFIITVDGNPSGTINLFTASQAATWGYFQYS